MYGGYYNPNQWPKEIWEQDMVYFKDARKTADSTHYYIFNFKETEIVIPDQFVGYTDLLTGKKVESGMRMKHYDALILNIPDTGV